jgi:hypothetical protein
MAAFWFVMLLIGGAIGIAITIKVISGFVKGMPQ